MVKNGNLKGSILDESRNGVKNKTLLVTLGGIAL